jgi:chorismate synthase
MSIPAVKAVEIGAGVDCAMMLGSEMHDEIFVKGEKYVRKTNNAGGLEGGMTNGEDIIIKATMKPIPTMKKPLSTVDFKDKTQCQAHFERSDVCAVSACGVVAEAMIACVLLDAFLDKFGKDNIAEIKKNYIINREIKSHGSKR